MSSDSATTDRAPPDPNKRAADTSDQSKAPPLQSAMSMLVFYINRAGKNLDENQKRILEQAKTERSFNIGRFQPFEPECPELPLSPNSLTWMPD